MGHRPIQAGLARRDNGDSVGPVVNALTSPGGPVDPALADDGDLAGIDAFAPMTSEEADAEQRVTQALRGAARRRLVGVLVALLVLGGLAAGAKILADRLGDEEPTAGGLVFEAIDEADAAVLGPPVAEPLLVTRLGTIVAVRAGEGPAESRIDAGVDRALLPVAPDSLAATVFSAHDGGQVLVTGPEGWLASGCVRASVVTDRLRAFDAVYYEPTPGACASTAIGRPADVVCSGPTTVVLGLRIPSGPVELEEGGTGGVDSIRVAVAASREGYDEVSVRGAIGVPAGAGAVSIPAYSAAPGTTIEVPLGEGGGGLIGSCTISTGAD